LVTDGAHAGVKGELMHIDGKATFVMPSKEDIHGVDVAHLAKTANNA
jgi:hypothetical protein